MFTEKRFHSTRCSLSNLIDRDMEAFKGVRNRSTDEEKKSFFRSGKHRGTIVTIFWSWLLRSLEQTLWWMSFIKSVLRPAHRKKMKLATINIYSRRSRTAIKTWEGDFLEWLCSPCDSYSSFFPVHSLIFHVQANRDKKRKHYFPTNLCTAFSR